MKLKESEIIGKFLDLARELNMRMTIISVVAGNCHPNISSLKTTIEEKCNKMSKEYILKVCKLFQWRFDAIIGRNGGHIE